MEKRKEYDVKTEHSYVLLVVGIQKWYQKCLRLCCMIIYHPTGYQMYEVEGSTQNWES